MSSVELDFTRLLETYYFDRLMHGEEKADKILKEAIESGSYTDVLVRMFKEAANQADAIVDKLENPGGEMHQPKYS